MVRGLFSRIFLPIAVLIALVTGLTFWPRTTSGQVQYYKMLGTVVPGDGTTAVYPSNYGAGFVGTVGGQYSCHGTGYFQGGSSFYDTGEVIPPGCEGYAEAQAPGYFPERVEPLVVNGDIGVDFTVYSQYAWLSGTIRDAITGAPLSSSGASAIGNCFNNKGNAIGGPDFSFGGTPGQPYYGGGLTMCRTGHVGPGQDTFRMFASAGSNYFSETQYLQLTSGQTVSGYQFALYPNQGNIRGTIRDAVTGAPVNASVSATFLVGTTLQSKGASTSNGSFTFASSTQPSDWGLWGLQRSGDSGPGSNDYTLTATASGYEKYVSPQIHVTSGTTTGHDIYLTPSNPFTGQGPCSGKACEQNAGNPINLTNGNTWIQQRDYSLPGLGGGLELVRTWNSLWRGSFGYVELAGMFGDSWRSTYEERLTIPVSTQRKYWRSDGAAWLFSYDTVTQAYALVSPPEERAWIVYDSSTARYTLTFLDGTKKIFNSGGYLIAILDRNGNQTSVSYDASNRITQVTDAAGRTASFTYVGSSRQASTMQDAVGVIATYTYSSSKLTRVTYADGSFINFIYDISSLITSVTDTDGKVLEAHTYSGYKGLTSERAGGVDKITVSYPQDGLTSLTDSRGNVTDYRYQVINGRRFVWKVAGAGCSTCGGRGNKVFVFDTKGNRTSSTDDANNTTTYTYDIYGNVTSRSVQSNPTTTLTWTYTYNGFGQVLTATDPMSNVTTNTYDVNGNLLSTSQAGVTTSFEYDIKGQLTRVTDPRNNSTTFTYTTAGLLATVTDALSNATTYGYDARGNRAGVTDPLNHHTTFTYNSMSRLTQVTYPDNSTTSFAYDNRGRRTSVTDANSKTTTYAYDDADRLTNVTDAATNVTGYGYDTESNLTNITDALGRMTSFAYDAQGRVTTATFPSTLQETYTYDAVGNLLTKTDRKGQTIAYTYDVLNRLTRKQYPDSSGVDYTYDNLNRLTRVVDATGTYDFTYDNLGRLTGTSTAYTFLPSRTFTVSYSYDAASNRTSMTDPESGISSYVYDPLNRLTSLTNFQSQQFTFSYDALSRRTQLTRPNGVNTAYTYDNLSRLLSVLHQLGGNTIDGATYTVDSVGNRTGKTNHLNSQIASFSYDPIYQLTQVTMNAATTESYSYDQVGNRLSSLGVSPYTYNSSNQLTSLPGVTFTYDNNGNTTGKTDASGTTSNTWDLENRLASVTLPNQSAVSFKYDPFGRRIQKTSAAGSTIYVYDGVGIVEEVDAAGAVVARYTQGLGIDEPLAMPRAGTTSYFEADGLGSITSLTDSAGAVAASYTYDSFGNLTVSAGTVTNPFRYTARESDPESGLYYFRARYYEALIGRFLGEDLLRFDSGVSFYSYVGNRPVLLIDPSGLLAELYCENIPSSRGGFVGSLPLLLAGAEHCYIRVQCNGKDETLELYGPPPGGKYGVPAANPFNPKRGGTKYPIYAPAGSQCCEFEQRLREAFDRLRTHLPEYNPRGPNSNTFANQIIQEAGGRADFPTTAIGHDWRPEARR